MLSVKTAVTPQLHASYSFLDKVVDMRVLFNDTCPHLSVQKTAKVPQLHCSFKVADVPVVQVVMVPQVLVVVNVPVIIQRQVRFSSTAEVPQIQFTARVVDILLCNRDRYEAFIRGVMVAVIGFFDAFCVIFRAPPVVPELSASFSSFRALTPVSARGLQRVCQFMTTVLWIYTHM